MAIEKDVFYTLSQKWRNIFQNGKLTRIDYGHIEPSLNGVIQKYRVHGLS